MAKRHPNRRQRAYQHFHAALPLADAAIRPLALASRDELAAWIRPPGAGRVRGPGAAARAAAPLQPAVLSTGGGRWRDADRPPGRTGGSGDGSKRASGAARVIAIGPNQDDAITATTTLLPDPFILRRIHPHHPNRLGSLTATVSIHWRRILLALSAPGRGRSTGAMKVSRLRWRMRHLDHIRSSALESENSAGQRNFDRDLAGCPPGCHSKTRTKREPSRTGRTGLSH